MGVSKTPRQGLRGTFDTGKGGGELDDKVR